MSPSDTRTRLADVLEPVVRAAGYDLEEIEVGVAGRRTVVRVFIDRLGGFTLDDVAEVSRAISATLDDNDHLVPGAYVLEVSSPGVDRPLTAPRHWLRNVGRLVRIQLDNGDEVTGRVLSADDAAAVLDVDGAERTVAYADVRRAQVQIELRRPTNDADTEDLDDTEEAGDTDDTDDMGDHEDMADMDTDDTDDTDDTEDPEDTEDIELDEELEADDLNLEDLELEPDVDVPSVDEDFDVETDDETGPADADPASGSEATGAGER